MRSRPPLGKPGAPLDPRRGAAHPAAGRAGDREAEIAGFDEALSAAADDPWLQAALLFLGTFVLEEAALMAGALLAAAGELPAVAALAALYLGMIVSDWALYGLGAAAARSARLRAWLGPERLARGRQLLGSNLTSALAAARLVPWLLFPILVACGFLRVGALRFAAIDALIALPYTAILFWLLTGFNILLFEHLQRWGWAAAVALILVTVVAIRWRGWRRRRDPP